MSQQSETRASGKAAGRCAADRRTVLLIGYGNTSRRDDGVAGHILMRLRERLGLAPIVLEDDVWLSDDGEIIIEEPPEGYPRIKMVLLHQLAPELGELVSRFDRVVFVDAHVKGATTVGGCHWEPVHLQAIDPAYQSGMVTHHLKPAAVLALAQSLYGRRPQGYVLSVLGHDFDFGDELSEPTSRLADEAVSKLKDLLCAASAME